MTTTSRDASGKPPLVLVTGSTGFVGRAVVRQLLAQGDAVRALVRAQTPWPFAAHLRLHKAVGDMRDRDSLLAACREVTGVIHLAAAKMDERHSQQTNVDGARHLVAACLANQVSFLINVSTQSAKLQNPGTYGRTKASADAIFHASGVPTTTLRASIVYGDLASGVFGSLVRFSKLPIIPVIGPGTCHFRPIHRDDLAQAIENAIREPRTRGNVYDAGGPDVVSLNELIDAILKQRGVRRVRLHVPVWLGITMARALSLLRRPPITVSNILGCNEEAPMDVAPFFRDFGFTPRSFSQGLQEAFAAEAQAGDREGCALLRYVAASVSRRWAPRGAHVERYRAAVKRHGIDPSHQLDAFVLRHATLLGSLDALSRLRHPKSTLRKKLLIAAAIFECDPDSAEVLLPKQRPLGSLAGPLIGLSATVLWKGIGALFLLFFPQFFRRNAGVL